MSYYRPLRAVFLWSDWRKSIVFNDVGNTNFVEFGAIFVCQTTGIYLLNQVDPGIGGKA